MDIELVAASPSPRILTKGLAETEGPFPELGLGLIRWARDERAELRIPAEPDLDRLRLTLSFRLHTRPRSVLAVICNGAEIKRLTLDNPMEWQELQVDLPFHPGENIVELRDIPILIAWDWADYLRRYRDVKRHVGATGQDPETGAKAHYEFAGKAEGRHMRQIELPRIPPGSNYYLFRSLRVEGFAR